LENIENFKNLKKNILKLPKINQELLSYLCKALKEISLNNEINKMSIENITICFQPNILTLNKVDFTSLKDIPRAQKVLFYLIKYEDFFFEEINNEIIFEKYCCLKFFSSSALLENNNDNNSNNINSNSNNNNSNNNISNNNNSNNNNNNNNLDKNNNNSNNNNEKFFILKFNNQINYDKILNFKFKNIEEN
jgi:hypothetical protein